MFIVSETLRILLENDMDPNIKYFGEYLFRIMLSKLWNYDIENNNIGKIIGLFLAKGFVCSCL